LKLKLSVAILLALLVAGIATAANPRDPKKVILPTVQVKAKAINVQLADLPAAGWKAKPASKSNSGQPRCSYYSPDQSDLTENGDADSPEFTLPSSSFVSSNTSIFKTATQGRTAYARVVQPKLPLCLAEVFRKGSGQPKNVTIVSAAARTFPKLADQSNAYRIVADFKTKAGNVRVFLDIVVMNRGKADVVVFFAGIGLTFKDAFEHSVAGKIAARTANA
jgi:hypothetical protein